MKKAIVIATTALLFAGCGEDNAKKSAKQTPEGNNDRSPAHVVAFPDTFPNISYKCDGRGNMIYVSSREHQSFRVLPDPSCPIADRPSG